MDFLKSRELVDFDQKSLAVAAGAILFNPIFWNSAARSEYHYKVLTRLCFNSPRLGCYFLAVIIFSLGIFRDYLYHSALLAQPTYPLLQSLPVRALAVVLFGAGNTLVLSSMWALGVTGTYLGDYFGILMDDMVTGFPFNLLSAPMYVGSTMSFLATALWMGRPAGVMLTGLVWAVYVVALRWEDEFTAGIYRRREEERSAKKGKGKKAQ